MQRQSGCRSSFLGVQMVDTMRCFEFGSLPDGPRIHRPSPTHGFRFSGENFTETLERARDQIGYSKIRANNGSEFISRDMTLWTCQRGSSLNFSRPSKPAANGLIEAFNSKFRSGFLNAQWFRSLPDACRNNERSRRLCNEKRSHCAIRNNPPITLVNSASETNQRC